ncbi:phosphonate C-P lyase system protein PhnH [Jiella sonneratiae]|uniref:Phosphonate C-P lyase system protein PhnH n=1 Tax=Jiella sonneratiae TaxID=2816856 RepID=A0ABS3J8Z6_9HYPH|nr:phosphonate C-P lyase system protein PhnH [Jiella sonneratiae]MBO0906154.1 phosphonate C-P lyase system protein PhnH [Jiella sonneratiae]
MPANRPIDLSSRAVEGGFANPVFDAQAVFAAVLQAISRPGTVADCGSRAAPPAPLSPAQGAILLALADAETGLFVEAADAALEAWLGFQTGARLTEAAGAEIAVAGRFDRSALGRFPLGTLAYPDRSATLIVEVPSFNAGPPLRLSGPGVRGSAEIRPAGLGEGFVAARRANRALAPCGLDLLLTCGSRVLALPRSTLVEEA